MGTARRMDSKMPGSSDGILMMNEAGMTIAGRVNAERRVAKMPKRADGRSAAAIEDDREGG